MTTDRTALRALIEAVEAGDANADVWRDIWRHDKIWTMQVALKANLAFKGSLNAAKALHEALLPEWGWTMTSDGFAQIDYDGDEPLAEGADFSDYVKEARLDGYPVRAWLLAILRALEATQEGE